MFDPATQSKIALWRQKAQEGTLSEEEMLEAVRIIRAGRMSAAVATEKATSRKKAAAVAAPSGDDLLGEMMG